MLDKLLRQILLLIEPIGFVWLCLLILTFLLWRRRQRRLASGAFCLAALIYLIGGTEFPGLVLLGSLERPYAGVDLGALPPADALVVLGGGAEPSRYEADRIHFTRAGDRLNMALEMLRQRKAGVFVIGGAGEEFDGKFIEESPLVAKWFGHWKGIIDPGLEMIPLRPCADTHDEAVCVRALATERGWHRVLLVTSANHMRRAVALFRTQGIDAVPVPCNFLTNVSTAPGPQAAAVPSWGGFEKIAVWLHEEVGWFEYRRRGWISAAP